MSGGEEPSEQDQPRLPRWLELVRGALGVVLLVGKVVALVCRLIRGH